MDNRITALREFLDASHSVYHAADFLAKTLENEGYTRLNEGKKWVLVPGGKYYLVRGGTAVIAFRIPEGRPQSFMMSASHSDRPTFKVKENAEVCGAYTKLLVERYGGMLIAPWLDRPLSIAGRVMVDTGTGIEAKLIDIDRDLLMIPNVAIHMTGRQTTATSGIPRWIPCPCWAVRMPRASSLPCWRKPPAARCWVTTCTCTSGRSPPSGAWITSTCPARRGTIWNAPGAAPRAS